MSEYNSPLYNGDLIEIPELNSRGLVSLSSSRGSISTSDPVAAELIRRGGEPFRIRGREHNPNILLDEIEGPGIPPKLYKGILRIARRCGRA
jgi:hypothetical protein